MSLGVGCSLLVWTVFFGGRCGLGSCGAGGVGVGFTPWLS